jgi:hypothetical protein
VGGTLADRTAPLLPGSNLSVVARLEDQFGQPLPAESRLSARALIDPRRSHGAVLTGERLAVALNGSLVWTGLSVSQPGEFSLLLRPLLHDPYGSGRRARSPVRGAVLFLRVGAPAGEKACEEALRRLVCFSRGGQALAEQALAEQALAEQEGGRGHGGRGRHGRHGGGATNGAELPPRPAPPEEEAEPPREQEPRVKQLSSYAPAPWALSLWRCASVLRRSGLRVSRAWRGGVAVHGRSAQWRMGTGAGMPHPGMDFWVRLGMHPLTKTVRARVLRRAYYRASLDWHPDRWALAGAQAQERAQRAFALVAEAYAFLALERVGDEEGVAMGKQRRMRKRMRLQAQRRADNKPVKVVLLEPPDWARAGRAAGAQ